MSFTWRHYSSDQDKYQMAALARQFSTHNLHVIDLPYRFSSWAFDDPHNIRLWFDQNQHLLAWAVIQTPFWSIDYALDADHEEDLHPEILAWAKQQAQRIVDTPYGRPAWFVNVFSGQHSRIHDLEEAGFTSQAGLGEDSWSKALLRRSAQIPITVYQPPTGYSARPLAGENEVQQYVELHQSVFGTKNMTVEWRRRTLNHPDYKPELDLVVQAPDGRLVAFCICWFDEASQMGQVEPLGSHQDFRQHGLGRVALSAGLNRLQSLGTRDILVETDNYRNPALRLYQSAGFQVIQDVLVYRFSPT